MTDVSTTWAEVIFRVKSSTQVVETSVTNNNSSRNYSHVDHYNIWTTDSYVKIKLFFIELPFAATYGASKHALQVCVWDENAVKQSSATIVSYNNI